MGCCATKAAHLCGGIYQDKGTARGIWVRRWWVAEVLCLLVTLKCSVHLNGVGDPLASWWRRLRSGWLEWLWPVCFRAWAVSGAVVMLCVSVGLIFKCCQAIFVFGVLECSVWLTPLCGKEAEVCLVSGIYQKTDLKCRTLVFLACSSD